LKQLSGSGNLPSDGQVKVVDWARQRAATSKSASAGVIVRSIVLVGIVSAVGRSRVTLGDAVGCCGLSLVDGRAIDSTESTPRWVMYGR
jgi:hypothetical protein